jgi:hypothetical protein
MMASCLQCITEWVRCLGDSAEDACRILKRLMVKCIAPVHLWKRLYDVMIEENRLLASDTDDDSIESDSLSVASDTHA